MLFLLPIFAAFSLILACMCDYKPNGRAELFENKADDSNVQLFRATIINNTIKKNNLNATVINDKIKKLNQKMV
jgi:hypothetical protein